MAIFILPQSGSKKCRLQRLNGNDLSTSNRNLLSFMFSDSEVNKTRMCSLHPVQIYIGLV